MSKKILVLGANGLIGRAVTEEIPVGYEWVGTTFSRVIKGMRSLNITSLEQIREIFRIIEPAYVIHCAGLNGGVDFCESHPDVAKEFHFTATIKLGEECLKYGAKFIFISSECVFDGKKELYSEVDEPNPQNLYGKFKADSEKWITDNLKDYLIVRTMATYGWDPFTVTPNAVMKLCFSIMKKEKTFIPTFRWGTPTYVRDLAKAIVELCMTNEVGKFNVVGSSYLNRYDWLHRVCEVLGWDASLVVPLDSAPQGYIFRPHRIGLENKKFMSRYRTKLHTIEEALVLLQKDYHSDKVFRKT